MSEQLHYLKAKLQRICSACNGPIAIGERIFPQDGEDGRLVYIHLTCAKQAQQLLGCKSLQAPICKHWRKRGFCLFRERCFFQHPALNEIPGSTVQALAAAATAVPAAGSARRRNKTKNRFRAGAFRRFLLTTFGREKLSDVFACYESTEVNYAGKEGGGVLDVAGGKGELAFELLNLNGIAATVVEPRPLDLTRQIKWLQAGFYTWNSAFLAYTDALTQAHHNRSADQPAAADVVDSRGKHRSSPLLPSHLRLMITPQLTACVVAAFAQSSSSSSQCENSAQLREMPAAWPTLFARAHHEAQGKCWASNATGHEEEESMPASSSSTEQQQQQLPALHQKASTADDVASLRRCCSDAMTSRADVVHQIREPASYEQFGAAVEAGQAIARVTDTVHAKAAWHQLTCCSLVAGMHPDQATDFIVDFALAANKPFAVVPCCVHAAQFPRRRVDGRPVQSYEDLIAYLVSKDPQSIRVAALPFEGRNKVVYRLPVEIDQSIVMR